LDQVERDLEEGVETPKVLTFFQLVEATTSNRKTIENEFKEFGLLGKGDTSRVIRENFLGIGGIDPGFPAQEGFVEGITVFGLENKTREELARSERGRYVLGLLEIERRDGGFFRIKPLDGRVVGVGEPKDGEGLIVYYSRTDQTPEGPVTTIGKEIIPRLVTAAGFTDESEKIYSGITATFVGGETPIDRKSIGVRINEAITKRGSTIYYKQGSEIADQRNLSRIDIEMVSKQGQMIVITEIDKKGKTKRRMLDRKNLSEADSQLLDPIQIERLEIAGKPLEFKPVIDPDFDDEIPVAEKADGFEIYKIGACTSYSLTEKERNQTTAYSKVPQNTKSIFRFVRPVVAFASKIAEQVKEVPGALNKAEYKPKAVELSDYGEGDKKDFLVIPVDPKANAQELSGNLKAANLLKYLALSRLNCIFPDGINQINFGIKRVQSPDNNSPFGLAIQFERPLPNNPDWEVVDDLFADPLMQRLMIQITSNSFGVAEINLGIKSRGIDIDNVAFKTIRSSDIAELGRKYNRLKIITKTRARSDRKV